MSALDDGEAPTHPGLMAHGFLQVKESRETISRGSLLSEIYRSYGEDRGGCSRSATPLSDAAAVGSSPLRLPPLPDSILEDSPPSSDNAADVYLSNGSNVTTPIPHSPLTPHTTPPRAVKASVSGAIEPWRITPVRDVEVPAKIKRFEDLSRSVHAPAQVLTTERTSSRELPDTTRSMNMQRRLELDTSERKSLERTGSNQKSRLKHKPDVEELRSPLAEIESTSPAEIGEWDANQMRNVTVRNKKREHRRGDRQPPIANLPTQHLHILKQRRAKALQDDAQPQNASETSTLSSQRQLSITEDMTKPSGSPHSAAIVTATVVDHSPPQRFPKLRHVSRNESLRSGTSQRSTRNSSNSEALSSSGSTSSAATSEHNTRQTELNASTITAPNTLRRRKDTIQLRPSAPTPDKDGMEHDTPPALSTSSPMSLQALGMTYSTTSIVQTSPRFVKDGRFVSDGSAVTLAPSAAAAGKSADSISPVVTASSYKANPARVLPHGSPLSLAPSAVTDVFFDAASHVSHNQSLETLHSYARHKRAWSSDRYPRMSLDRSVDGTRRTSLDLSLAPSERYHRFSSTSGRSDFTEAYDVQEAAAIEIYPHNNGSLVVVQSNDPVRDAQIGRGLGDVTPMSIKGRDSPLNNPRQAPLPPAVTIQSPTPARELDAPRESANEPPGTPTRRASLMRSVRRYSDSFLQPITGSIRRRNGARRPNGADQDGSLHPFWRPRHFWNDLSDSEDESTSVEARNAPSSRSTFVRSDGSARPSWRRGGSIRDFLVGNTLGLNREPSNKRKPQITLPPSNKRDLATNVQKPRTSVRDSARSSGRGHGKPERSSSVSKALQTWKEKRIEKHAKKAEEADDAQRERRRCLRSQIRVQVPSQLDGASSDFSRTDWDMTQSA